MSNTEEYNFGVYQGETFIFVLEEFQDKAQTIPLSNVGYTGKLQVRAYPDSTSPVIVELTAGSGLTPGGADGMTTVRFGADKTLLITSAMVYDLRYVSNSDPTDVRYPITGTISTKRRVTT